MGAEFDLAEDAATSVFSARKVRARLSREGQKPIVIGAKGERLKRVGTAARLTLNEMLKRRLHLTLWVKVRENWADNARALKELGLE